MICFIRLLHWHVVWGLIHVFFFEWERKYFQYLWHLPGRLLSNVWVHVGDRLPPVESARTCCLRFIPIEFARINKKKRRIGLCCIWFISHCKDAKTDSLHLDTVGWIPILCASTSSFFLIWHPRRADICQRRRNVFLICSIKQLGLALCEMSTQSNRNTKSDANDMYSPLKRRGL